MDRKKVIAKYLFDKVMDKLDESQIYMTEVLCESVVNMEDKLRTVDPEQDRASSAHTAIYAQTIRECMDALYELKDMLDLDRESQ